MKNKITFLRVSLLLTLMSLFFVQCEKETTVIKTDSALPPAVHPMSLGFSMEANDWTAASSKEPAMQGLFVTFKEGRLSFEQVMMEDHLLVRRPIDHSFSMQLIQINGLGEAIQIDRTDFSEEELASSFGDFDLVYLNWKDLEMIAHHSNKLYFTPAKINYGFTIHRENSEDQLAKDYSTIKVEGDFEQWADPMIPAHAITPRSLVAIPCPPYWVPD